MFLKRAKRLRFLVYAGGIAIGLFLIQPWVYPLGDGSQYRFVRAFGSDVLERPIGVTASSGRIYVTDTGHDRMVVFNQDGEVLGAGGETGDKPGQFRRPMHLASGPDGNIYVADMLNHRIQVFSPRGTPIKTIGTRGQKPGQLNQPAGVAVDADGNLYVAEFTNERVQKLSPDGTSLKTWGHTQIKGYLRRDYFNYPADVALAGNGHWFVADTYNDRVKHYGSNGQRLSVWGGLFGLNIPGPFRGWFKGTQGLDVSKDGQRVYVADFGNHRIQVMGPDGTYLSQFGTRGHGPEQMIQPTDVTVRPDGTVFVVDFGNDRIQVWKRVDRP